MAKSKNKKKISSDKVNNRRKLAKTVVKTKSPFEVHIDKEKMKVLGRKNKNLNLPGLSRAKAIDKRKKTLLQECKVQNKSNIFADKRIGERNQSLSAEEKQMARFAAVRVKSHKKKSIFNLGEDEVLTHKGQSLSEIEKFDDPRSDDDFEDEETGKLDEKFVEEAHFGGGVLRKTGKEGAKTHKDLIEQLIAESKKRKAEKQKVKEATLELTEKLDSEWKDLIPLMSRNTKSSEDNSEKPKVDDYDVVMRELKFEARGSVSDRLKSEEEIAKEEKKKLEKLEKERLERMQGNTDKKSNKVTHRSADDLDDDFVYESEPDEIAISYGEDGKSNVPLNVIQENGQIGEEEHSEEKNQSAEESENDSEVETESEDDLSDLKAESSDSEVDEAENIKEVNIVSTHIVENSQEIKDDLLKRKEIMEKAREELPYTYSLPESYEKLQSTLSDKSTVHQGIIIERMIKCNHASLAQGNKNSLGVLFAYILQYINDLAEEVEDEDSIKHCFQVFEQLTPHLFDLAQIHQESCHNSIREVIKEKFHDYWKKPKEFPGLENLLFFKLVSLLFTTSDFRHQIVTPCLIFMEEIFIKCRVRTKRHISYGLFLSTLVLEYTNLSKRFMPGCLNFLGGILHMAIPKSTVRLIKVLPPFQTLSSELVLLNDQTSSDASLKMEVTDLIGESITESYKIRAIYSTLQILNELFDNLKNLASNLEIFEPIYNYCCLIPEDMYPEAVQTALKSVLHKFELCKDARKLEFVAMEAAKPKALRLYEPKIVEVYDGKRFKVQSREKAERDKLIHKLKRERKGALRELRRDNAFLSRVKITEQIRSDKERREKVKRIFSEASVQQSELNALDRKKKKK